MGASCEFARVFARTTGMMRRNASVSRTLAGTLLYKAWSWLGGRNCLKSKNQSVSQSVSQSALSQLAVGWQLKSLLLAKRLDPPKFLRLLPRMAHRQALVRLIRLVA